MEEPVVAFDLQRMIFGNQPALFYLEIVVRTIIIYAYAMVLLRWLGSRAVGQLSTIEFLLVIALGSAVGDVMFYPEVPLLHALAVVTIVVLANKGLDLLMQRSDRAERLIDGEPSEVIRDGVIDAAFLAKGSITREEVFQRLREGGFENLGEVRGAYIEKDGKLTAFRYKDGARPGLAIVPPHAVDAQSPVVDDAEDAVCMRCGKVREGAERHCGNCGASHWIESTRSE
jgi:uncharacterized membrane protein YcaP (DUF421 family)